MSPVKGHGIKCPFLLLGRISAFPWQYFNLAAVQSLSASRLICPREKNTLSLCKCYFKGVSWRIKVQSTSARMEENWAYESTEIFPAAVSAPLAELSPDCTPGSVFAFGRACLGWWHCTDIAHSYCEILWDPLLSSAGLVERTDFTRAGIPACKIIQTF